MKTLNTLYQEIFDMNLPKETILKIMKTINKRAVNISALNREDLQKLINELKKVKR